jgi:hypothetical protein
MVRLLIDYQYDVAHIHAFANDCSVHKTISTIATPAMAFSLGYSVTTQRKLWVPEVVKLFLMQL